MNWDELIEAMQKYIPFVNTKDKTKLKNLKRTKIAIDGNKKIQFEYNEYKASENFNDNHPEKKEGERWYANVKENRYINLPFQTKRKGKIAYDIKGKILSDKDIFPVFILKAELEEQQRKYIKESP